VAADVSKATTRRSKIHRLWIATDGNLDVWREDRAVYLKVPCGALYVTFELTLDEARELARALEDAAQ